MSRSGLNTLREATDSLRVWNDSNRTQFDKLFVEPIINKTEAYEAAMAELQSSMADVARLLDNLIHS